MNRTFRCAMLALLTALTLLARVSAADPPYGAWQLTIESGPPFPSAVAMDTRREQFLMYGGTFPGLSYGPGAHSPPYSVSDLPLLDRNGYSHTTLGPAPGARSRSAAAYDSLSDRFYLFGGDSVVTTYAYLPSYYSVYYKMLSDLWVSDRTLLTWTRIPADAGAMPTRVRAALTVDTPTHRLLLFGGTDTLNAPFRDLWALSLDSPGAWTPVAMADPPPAFSSASSIFDPVRRRFMVLTGTGSSDTTRPRLYGLSVDAPAHWQEIPLQGTVPSLAGAVLTYDRSRDAIVVAHYNAKIDRIPLSGPAYFQNIPMFDGPSPVGGSPSSIGYDETHDLLLMPNMASVLFGGFTTNTAIAQFARVPIQVSAQYDSVSFRRGVVAQTWDVTMSGDFRAVPHLQRRVALPDSAFADAAYPGISPASGSWLLADTTALLPGIDYEYRMAWSDWRGQYALSPIPISTPPAPRAVAFSIDSAFVSAGRAHVAITLANDSLSVIARPWLERRSLGSVGGTSTAAQIWPDSLRRIAWIDSTFTAGDSCEYALRWNGPYGVPVREVIATLVGAGTYAQLDSTDVAVDHLRATWRVPTGAGFPARLQTRTNDGPWLDSVPIVSNSRGELSAILSPLRLGTRYAVRLTWLESGIARFSAPVIDTVPPPTFHATAEAHTDGVTLRFRVTPLAPGLRWHLRRYAFGSFSDLPAITPDATGRFEYVDARTGPAASIGFAVIVDDGVGRDSSSVITSTPLTPPYVIAKHIGTQTVDYAYALTAGTAEPVLEQRIAGLWQDRSAVIVPTADTLRASVGLSLADAPSYVRLRWKESDGLIRRTAIDSTLVLAAFPLDSVIAFGARRAKVGWRIVCPDSTFLLALSRSENGGPFVTLTTFDARTSPLFAFTDTTLAPAAQYVYRIESPFGPSRTISGTALPLLGTPHVTILPGVARTVWPLVGLTGASDRAVVGTLERSDPSGAWHTVGPVESHGDSVVAEDATVTLDVDYAWRVRTQDPFGALTSPIASARIPAESVALLASSSDGQRVRLRWSVTPDGPDFVMRVTRLDLSTGLREELGAAVRDSAGRRAYTDSTALAGHHYSYQLAYTLAGRDELTDPVRVELVGASLRFGSPFPNPASGAFTESIAIPDARTVRLELLDLQGRRLLEREFTGPAVIDWRPEPGSLAPGVYLLRLAAPGSPVVTRRVALLR